MNEQFPADRFTRTVTGHMVEWRRDLPVERPTADALFSADHRIGERADVMPGGWRRLPETAIATGMNFAERTEEGNLHTLRGVVNVRGKNYGIATARVDGRPVTYVTRFGEKSDQGVIVGMVDQSRGHASRMRIYDGQHHEGVDDAVFAVNFDGDHFHVMNLSTEEVRLGTASPEASNRRGFSVRGALSGLKKAIFHRRSNERPDPNADALSGKMGWLPPANQVAQYARWMRERQYDYLHQTVGASR